MLRHFGLLASRNGRGPLYDVSRYFNLLDGTGGERGWEGLSYVDPLECAISSNAPPTIKLERCYLSDTSLHLTPMVTPSLEH